MIRRHHSVHVIDNEDNFSFSTVDYSKLKFGCNQTAKQFGTELANSFFQKHADMLLVNQCVVIPSPYNYLPNAASIMTIHFINQLNNLLVHANGSHVESSTIHRKVTYTSDYGFLSKTQRQNLIANDDFYLNTGFLSDKTLLFVDDVRITGTHEDVLANIMSQQQISNPCYYLYYAIADQSKKLSPSVEAAINFKALTGIDDFITLANSVNYQTIVRPVKYLLTLNEQDIDIALSNIVPQVIESMYYGALGEGYYKIPKFHLNFIKLRDAVCQINKVS